MTTAKTSAAAVAAVVLLIAMSSAPGSHPIPLLLATLHVVAAAACIDRARRPVFMRRDLRRTGRPRLWLAVAAGSIVLLASRVTALLPMLTQVGRDLASAQGWYDDRRPVQVLALSVVALAAAMVAPSLVGALRRQTTSLRQALAAVTILLGLLILRVVSLHQVEHVLASGVAGVELEYVIEVAATATIILAATTTWKPPPAPATASCPG